MAQKVIKLSVSEQRFGGYTAPVQTSAAGALFLDAGYALAKLGSSNSTDITGGSAPDDN
jgi:hypothetical protein